MTKGVFTRELSAEFEYGRSQTPEYDFLNRSPRAEVESVRLLIEEWFGRVPQNERARILSSLRSRKNPEHWGAFFELFCHEMLLRNGYGVEMQPHSPHGKTKDFRASGRTFAFEMEASVCLDSFQNQHSVVNQLTDFIDEHAFAAGFRYSIQLTHEGSNLPPLRLLSEQIRDWANGFNREEQRRLLEESNFEALPVRTFSHDDWEVEIRLIPRPIDESQTHGFKKAIGIGPVFSGWLQHDKAMLNTLKGKAAKYPDRDHPFIIAINTMFGFGTHDEIDVFQALLGTERVTVDLKTLQSKPSRAADGLWIGPKGPRNKRVSGVFVANHLRSWNVPRTKITLYLNPWAEKPIDHSVLSCDAVSWDLPTGRKVEHSGKNPSEIFCLDPNWPETVGSNVSQAST